VRKKLRFLLAPKMVGERVKALLPKRPFLGITRELRADVEEMIGVQIMEVK
jgi:phage gpG-like protein